MSAELSITLFGLSGVAFFLGLPFLMDFSKKEWLDMLFKRSCWIIGIYLMVLNAGTMLTIANKGGLVVSYEISFYMYIFSMCGYLLIFYTLMRMFFDFIQLRHLDKQRRRGLVDE